MVDELEIKEPESSLENPEERKESEINYSEEEKQAMEMGWTPKDKYKGDPERYIEAKEYIGRSDLYRRISDQNDKIKKMDKTIEVMADLNKRQYEMIHKDRNEWYRMQKKAAIEANNPEDVEKYENLIKGTEEEIKRYAAPAEKELPLEVKSFVERNKSWFNNSTEDNERMVRYAQVYEDQLAQKFPSMSVEERLNKTEKEIKSIFSHKFENPNRNKAAAVGITANENRSSISNSKRKYTIQDVPSGRMRQAVENMAETSGMDVDYYIRQLYETGALKNE